MLLYRLLLIIHKFITPIIGKVFNNDLNDNSLFQKELIFINIHTYTYETYAGTYLLRGHLLVGIYH